MFIIATIKEKGIFFPSFSYKLYFVSLPYAFAYNRQWNLNVAGYSHQF